MKRAKQIGFTVIAAALAIVPLGGCSPAQESVQQYTIPVQVTVEEKTVYVDNFLNLTENADLNLFEDGVADMLEQSLTGVNSVRVVPRLTVQKMIAANVSDDARDSIIEAAKTRGAQYIVDGWISRTEKGNYRIYANIFNLVTRQMQEKIAVAEFSNRDEALPKLSDFVEEITGKLSQSRKDLEELSELKSPNYEIYRMRMLAWQSESRGRPDVAVSLLEKALESLKNEKIAKAETDKVRENMEGQFKLHFSLAEIYTEMHDRTRALDHLEIIYPDRDQMPQLWRPFVEALWSENHGELAAAKKIYSDYAAQMPQEAYFYRRLADIAIANGEGRHAAIVILEDGLKKSPADSSLTRRIAELKMAVDGDKAIENYVDTRTVAEKKSALTSEVISSMLNAKLEQDFVKNLPALIPIVVQLENADKGDKNGLVRLSQFKIDTSKLISGFDYSCPDETQMAVRLAAIAARSGNKEFAREIANAIQTHGTAPNSGNAYFTIASTISLLDGHIAEAKDFAMKIDRNDPARYLVIGNILVHQGYPEKGAAYMEKALQLEKSPHPLMYYYVANAHMLAGHYKEWNDYNRKFLETSAEQNLVPESVKKQIFSFYSVPEPVATPAPTPKKREREPAPEG